MNRTDANYLKDALMRHVRFHFHSEAVKAFESICIHWLDQSELDDLQNVEAGAIVIPLYDQIERNTQCFDVPFREGHVRLWGRVSPPGKGWSEAGVSPAWFENGAGIYIPAWDLAGVLFDLLTLSEEIADPKRDQFKRFTGAMSPRADNDRLNVPVFNNAAALLCDLCMKLIIGETAENIPLAKGLRVCLSHDLDQLRGDDFWTQAARAWRIIAPLRRGRFPDLEQINFMIRNMLWPRAGFMDDLLGMLSLERDLGFRSVNYVLSGRRGRFGARTGAHYIKEYLRELPEGSAVGLHYNYDTHLNTHAFRRQKRETEILYGHHLAAGRAHYLRMDPEASFAFWATEGIKVDESLGYPDRVGYRAGIGGAFLPRNSDTGEALEIVSLPLIAMDGPIAGQFGDDYLEEIKLLASQLALVGGTFTLLFHPGLFENPEARATVGMYRALLEMLHNLGAESVLPAEVADAYLGPLLSTAE